MRSRRWRGSRNPRARSPTSSASSTRSPARPIYWRSTPRWRRRAPATPAAASPWWLRGAQPRAALVASGKGNQGSDQQELEARSKNGVGLVNRGRLIVQRNRRARSRKVAEIVADIAAASAEQASGIEQINKALAQMDEVTQQNSALVEENTASAKTLEEQSDGHETNGWRSSAPVRIRARHRNAGRTAPERRYRGRRSGAARRRPLRAASRQSKLWCAEIAKIPAS